MHFIYYYFHASASNLKIVLFWWWFHKFLLFIFVSMLFYQMMSAYILINRLYLYKTNYFAWIYYHKNDFAWKIFMKNNISVFLQKIFLMIWKMILRPLLICISAFNTLSFLYDANNISFKCNPSSNFFLPVIEI